MLGNLTGFNRDRADALFGQNQIKEWLTRPELAPPLLEESNALHPQSNYKYHHISSIVPSTETLSDVRKRLLPFFYDQLLSNLYLGKNIILVTHEDIVKAIIRLMNNYAVDEFVNYAVPIGIPIVFEFSLNTNEFINGYYFSSTLLENNTDNQQQLFPTGFDINKIKSTEKLPALNFDSKTSNLQTDLDIKANPIDQIYPSIDQQQENKTLKFPVLSTTDIASYQSDISK
ncbi:unnamed protein product [Rotaria magnacalcarata]|nr:unnamed protein product [Rotaria magnacalcarata]